MLSIRHIELGGGVIKGQFYQLFYIRFYEATVEGRSLRSSAGAPEEEEEESGDEEAEEGKDYSWKKTIMIGPTYQASVPAGLCSYDDTPPYENEDKQLWDPTRLSEEVSREYLAKSADKDPLVIDEEKPPEDEDGNYEENKKEFEPTVDMIMNEFDDERTIEEEEVLGQEDEGNRLKLSEIKLIIKFLDEEILALEKEQDMPIEELLKLYGYNNSQKDAVEKPAEEPEKKEESDQEEIVEPDVEVEPPPEIIADASKGEKRGSSSPPPSKKARSELAK